MALGVDGSPGPISWNFLTDGPALMLCHGTLNSVSGSFNKFLSSREYQAVHQAYNGRVFGFDHPTLSKTPEQNAERLMKILLDDFPRERNLDLTIFSASRGGLVSRQFIHQLQPLKGQGINVNVSKLVMSSCPNRGTMLAHPDKLADYLDRITNLMNMVPDNFFTDALIYILDLVKLLARGILGGLRGIQAMNPENPSLKALNDLDLPVELEQYAISAEFEPGHEGLRKIWRGVIDHVVDAIFDEPNDGIVPTNGVSDIQAQIAGFPIRDHYSKPAGGHPSHELFSL